ncbi:hypothetical protein BJV78DRAFT_112304 [Lactifluus subvellereus]|nr:hypothetical protein BJV78DRAFT_112304 [Lactifluus subvellereus]
MRIDYIYNRTLQLFEEAAVDNYFFRLSESPIIGDTTWAVSPNRRVHANPQNATPGSPPALNEEKMGVWLRKLSEVLPEFVGHRSTGNVSRITETKYHFVLRAYMKIIVEYSWFDRTCFSMVALLMQCNTTTVNTIFGDTRTALDSSMSPFSSWSRLKQRAMAWFIFSQSPQSEDIPHQGISSYYFVNFLVQTGMCLELHLDAAAGIQLPLLAPSLPHIDPASVYNDPFKVGPATMSSQPWLRNGLARTPLAGISSMTGRPWAGYYTILRTGARCPPMFFELRSSNPSLNAETEYLLGEGQDDMGPFSLRGTCDTRTGSVTTVKAHTAHTSLDYWGGIITPFGMVGRWVRGGGIPAGGGYGHGNGVPLRLMCQAVTNYDFEFGISVIDRHRIQTCICTSCAIS